MADQTYPIHEFIEEVISVRREKQTSLEKSARMGDIERKMVLYRIDRLTALEAYLRSIAAGKELQLPAWLNEPDKFEAQKAQAVADEARKKADVEAREAAKATPPAAEPAPATVDDWDDL